MKHYTTPSMSCLPLPDADILTASFQTADEGLGDSINYYDLC